VGKIQTGRFERLSARTYSIKGPGALVDLDETVLGVLQLERQAGMEAHLMQQWDTFGAARIVTPLAGEFTWIALMNPIGSGRLMVIDGWQRSDAGVFTSLFITRGIPPGFVALATSTGLDSRIAVGRQSAGNLLWNHDLSGSFGINVAEVRSTEFQNQSYVLAPDGTLMWRSGVVNERLTITVRWAEREAAPFEI